MSHDYIRPFTGEKYVLHSGIYRRLDYPSLDSIYEARGITRCSTFSFTARFSKEWKARMFVTACNYGVSDPKKLFRFLDSSNADATDSRCMI